MVSLCEHCEMVKDEDRPAQISETQRHRKWSFQSPVH